MLKARQRLGKYRIEKRLSRGPLANVYQAFDTIHLNRVALKIPHVDKQNPHYIDDFIKEVQLAFKLEHPNVLPVQNASYIDEHFVIATPLGIGTLGDRLEKRMSLHTAMLFADQVLAGAAFAHSKRILHCDIKPENYIHFPDNVLKLGDFGFARRILRSVKGSGSGTLGYIAPEQAMGRPSFHSDVFSLGLILFRLFSGKLPEWPYDWPPEGYKQLRDKLHPELVEVIRKSIEISPAARFSDAVAMHAAFDRVKRRTRKQRSTNKKTTKNGLRGISWQKVRWQEFQRRFKKELETKHSCRRCKGPVAESMNNCPWCSTERPVSSENSTFPAQCPRCSRGVKLDWNYCAWCYGPGFQKETNREFTDKRYGAKCANAKCDRRVLMPFMRYCPWCRTKVRKNWRLPGAGKRCGGCGWGVAKEFWRFCPWCRTPVKKGHHR
ncbi:MAG: protein kinase [Gammaproteobacteria bacterium]|nr:protein kinase [Gammaproteobacteria bacterium]